MKRFLRFFVIHVILFIMYFSSTIQTNVQAVENYNTVKNKNYAVNIGHKKYIAKYSDYNIYSKVGKTYYLSGNDTLSSYKSIVRVNYIISDDNPNLFLRRLINAQGDYPNFEYYQAEQVGNAVIGAYSFDLYNLATQQNGKQLSVLKIAPARIGLKVIEIVIVLPESSEQRNKINLNLNGLYTYLRTKQVPLQVKENFGVLPNHMNENWVIRTYGFN